MTAYPEQPTNPPEPAPSVEAEREAIEGDSTDIACVIANDGTTRRELADLYKTGCRDGLLYFDAIDQAIQAEAERRYEEHTQ